MHPSPSLARGVSEKMKCPWHCEALLSNSEHTNVISIVLILNPQLLVTFSLCDVEKSHQTRGTSALKDGCLCSAYLPCDKANMSPGSDALDARSEPPCKPGCALLIPHSHFVGGRPWCDVGCEGSG